MVDDMWVSVQKAHIHGPHIVKLFWKLKKKKLFMSTIT